MTAVRVQLVRVDGAELFATMGTSANEFDLFDGHAVTRHGRGDLNDNHRSAMKNALQREQIAIMVFPESA